MRDLVVAFPRKSGGWAAVPPDFVGVTGRAEDAARAVQRAAGAAGSVLEAPKAISAPHPVPSDLGAVRRNYVWAQGYGIGWWKAVVSTESWQLDDPADNPQPPQDSARRRHKERT